MLTNEQPKANQPRTVAKQEPREVLKPSETQPRLISRTKQTESVPEPTILQIKPPKQSLNPSKQIDLPATNKLPEPNKVITSKNNFSKNL